MQLTPVATHHTTVPSRGGSAEATHSPSVAPEREREGEVKGKRQRMRRVPGVVVEDEPGQERARTRFTPPSYLTRPTRITKGPVARCCVPTRFGRNARL